MRGIAERTGAILSRIDALLCFTQLHITEGSLDYARAYLAEARLLSDQIHLAYYADKIQSAENEIDAPSVAAIWVGKSVAAKPSGNNEFKKGRMIAQPAFCTFLESKQRCCLASRDRLSR